MSHAQPCRVGFLSTPCPQCRAYDRHDRLKVEHRIIEAPEHVLRGALHKLNDIDRDVLVTVLDAAEADL